MDWRSIASVRQRNRFAGFHHAQLGFDLALFQFALEFFGCPRQHWKGAVVDWHDAARIHRFHRISGADWSHGEMIADAYQHDIDLVVIGDTRDVGKECCVAGVINGWTVANGEDESARVPCVNWWRHLVLYHARSMPCRHKTNRRITIEQSELPTESAGCVVAGLFRRI